MSLPTGELHGQRNWILREKRKIKGRGWVGQYITTNYTNYKCNQCDAEYVRFPDDDDYIELKVGKSIWEWGWARVK